MGPLVNDLAKDPYQWFKDFSPLIGATLAGIGLYVAWLAAKLRNPERRC
jgi:hypothetical protein